MVPVINENDTVVTDEIRFGDNDTLAALVANLVGPTCGDPYRSRWYVRRRSRNNPDAQLIYEARPMIRSSMRWLASAGPWARRNGSPLWAACLAARSGGHTVIVGGRSSVLDRLRAGERPAPC